MKIQSREYRANSQYPFSRQPKLNEESCSILMFCSRHLDIGLGPEAAEISNGKFERYSHLGGHHNEAHVPP